MPETGTSVNEGNQPLRGNGEGVAKASPLSTAGAWADEMPERSNVRYGVRCCHTNAPMNIISAMNITPDHLPKSLAGKPPIGLSNFPELIREGYSYVDKSLLIRSVLDSPAQVLLLPRPRRFGKTLNISMLRTFFDRDMPGSAELFRGLDIERAGEEYATHQGRYPVVFLTLKDVKTLNWDDCIGHLRQLISREFKRHEMLLESGFLDTEEQKQFRKIRSCECAGYELERSLSNFLYRVGPGSGRYPHEPGGVG
uniref:Predicted AAA-ATPase n=1 Tax=Candidatus Kentrum sp. LFY TaxID=2126342 RepID=A0A450UVY3_9GAMM|nr:MAG: Predicted AAA-ATPase [Candidatus Kentron sp. LFY]